MEIEELKSDVGRRMEGAFEVLYREFGGLRTGRASISLLEPITVEAYGQTMPMSQVGTVGVPEARLLTVQVCIYCLAVLTRKYILETLVNQKKKIWVVGLLLR